MKNKKTLSAIAFSLSFFSLQAQIQQEVISLNFNSNSYAPLAFEEAGVVKATHWVGVNGSSGENGRPSQIKNNSGYPTTTKLFYNLNNKAGSSEPVDLSSPDQCMLSGVEYYDKRDNSLHFKYIPESFSKYGYDVYMYWNKHETEPVTAIFQKGSDITYYLYQETNQNYQYIKSEATTEESAKENPTANYVVFENNTENYPKFTVGRISGMQLVSHKGMKPQSLFANNVNTEGFTLNWAEIKNAENYQIECYKVLFFEDFINFESFDANTFTNSETASESTNEEKFNSLTRETGWTLNSGNIYNAGGYFRLGSGNAHGSFTTPAFVIGENDNADLSIEVKFEEGCTTNLLIELLDEEDAVQNTYTIKPEEETTWTGEWFEQLISLADVTPGKYRMKLSSSAGESGQRKVWVDNLIVSKQKTEESANSNMANVAISIAADETILCRVKAESTTVDTEFSYPIFVTYNDIPSGIEETKEYPFHIKTTDTYVEIIQNEANPQPVLIFDLSGRQIYSSAKKIQQKIDLQPGYYIIRIGNISQKIIVE